MTWIKNKDPEEAGYYLTCYSKDNKSYFKAFWYNLREAKWIFYRFDPDVKCWWDKRFDYYVPCQMQEGVDPLPEEFWNVKRKLIF